MRRIAFILATLATLVVASTASADIFCSNQSGDCNGTDGANTIVGTIGADLINAKDGNDLVHGRTGTDEIHGGYGDDDLYAGGGINDAVFGGGDNDRVLAGCHPNNYTCQQGTSGSGTELRGMDAGDTLGADNGIGFEDLFGGEGSDTCFGDSNDSMTNCEKRIINGVCQAGCSSLAQNQRIVLRGIRIGAIERGPQAATARSAVFL